MACEPPSWGPIGGLGYLGKGGVNRGVWARWIPGGCVVRGLQARGRGAGVGGSGLVRSCSQQEPWRFGPAVRRPQATPHIQECARRAPRTQKSCYG